MRATCAPNPNKKEIAVEKIDYNKQMQNVARQGQTLLLHICCAPCSAGVLPRLNGFRVVPYFYNPNIDSREEYELRAAQFGKLGIEPHICAYDPDEFLRAVRGLEEEKEGGARCKACIALRLEKTAQYAKQIGADLFCSTLSVSPHKDAAYINETGARLAQTYGVPFLPNDFKKENGFLLSTRVSKEKNLYRQSYCGCIFSKEKV